MGHRRPRKQASLEERLYFLNILQTVALMLLVGLTVVIAVYASDGDSTVQALAEKAVATGAFEAAAEAAQTEARLSPYLLKLLEEIPPERLARLLDKADTIEEHVGDVADAFDAALADTAADFAARLRG